MLIMRLHLDLWRSFRCSRNTKNLKTIKENGNEGNQIRAAADGNA